MPVTLEQAKATMQDKIIQSAIDEFRRSSFLLDQLTFDDAVSLVLVDLHWFMDTLN